MARMLQWGAIALIGVVLTTAGLVVSDESVQTFCESAHSMPTTTYHTRPSWPIPPGFDHPAPADILERMRDENDVRGMREHAWRVLAGMTSRLPDGSTVFESWFTTRETFAPQEEAARRANRGFDLQTARQRAGLKVRGDLPPLVTVLFSGDAYAFIRSRALYQVRTLDNWKQQGYANIECFPNTAVTAKLIWWPIQQNGISAVPVWDVRNARNADCGPSNIDCRVGNDFTTWHTVVAVDPSRTATGANEFASVMYYDYREALPYQARLVRRTDARLFPLSAFYYFQLSKEDIEDLERRGLRSRLDDVMNDLYGGTQGAQAGDYLMLVGMHMATKEIPDWTWTTIWWDGRPETSAFGEDRPPEIQDEWRNYLLDVTFSVTVPREADGSYNITFNPWLEGPMRGGILSNCAACHQRSLWPVDFADPGNTTRGPISRKSGPYADCMGLDYVWSIPLESK